MPQTAAELMLAAFSALRPGQPAWLAVGERCVEVLSLVQRCTDALAVRTGCWPTMDDDDSVGRLEVALSRALWLTGRWEEAEERARSTLERPGLPAALRARLEALHALALARVRSPAAPGLRPSAPWRLPGPPPTGRAGCSPCTRSPRSRATRAITGHRCRISGSCAPSRAGVHRAGDHGAAASGPVRSRRDDARQAWHQSGNDSAGILPSLLYAQIWQDYNLARLDGADAAARALMRLGAELGSRICQLESAAILSRTALVRGDAEEARQRISLGGRADAAELAHIPVLMLVRGWLLAEEGDPAMAVALLTPLAQGHGRRTGPVALETWLDADACSRAGLAAGDSDFACRAVELAEEGAQRNPGVATFEAIAQGLRGLLGHDLDRLAQAADIVTRSPRPLVRAGVFEDYGRALLAAGDLTGGGDRLDQAWALYDEAGAHGCRAAVQQAMRAAGIRRSWWASAQSRPTDGWASLTEAEIRVAKLIADGHTNKSAATELGVSANTVGTHLRSVFAKLGRPLAGGAGQPPARQDAGMTPRAAQSG